MIITNIEKYDKYRTKVTVDYELSLVLYHKEIEMYDFIIDNNISEETYNYIVYELLYSRAKEKALKLIELSSRPKGELIKKLAITGYNLETINKVVDFLEEYGFIDDYKYVVNYVNYTKEKKNKMQMTCALLKKGISKEIINQVFEEQYIEEQSVLEEQQIKKQLDRYRDLDGNIPLEKKEKVIASLYRKGYKTSTIMKFF